MAENKFFGPLTLHQKRETALIFKCSESHEVNCVLCDLKFNLPDAETQMLTHFFMAHRLIINDVNLIADLPAYLSYWRVRFREEGVPYFCSEMDWDQLPDGTRSTNEKYFLLCEVHPEDKELRSHLQHTRLENLMKRHQFEREDKNFERECLFCRFTAKDTRTNYLNHLYEKHNFHIAKPENLVCIDQLIELIAFKLDKLQCIFCEKYFKDRIILKEHMRKKGHKRINPDNKEYDKFFLVNYGDKKPEYKQRSAQPVKKNYKEHNRDAEQDSNVDSDPEWSEWTEENGQLINCLICEHNEPEYDLILDHMERSHNFNFTKSTDGLDFYHKIKIVNYIRRKIYLGQCLHCETKFDDNKNLEKHLVESKHIILSKEKWDQPEYYFPTYEDDLFLCFIQDEDESWWSGDEREVERRNSMSDCISKEMALSVLNE